MKFSWKKKLAIILSFVFVFSASIFIFKDEVFAQNTDCTILPFPATKLRPGGVQPVQYGAPDPFAFPSGGFSDSNPPFVYIDVKTLNCQNQVLVIKIINAAGNNFNDVLNGSGGSSLFSQGVMHSSVISIGSQSPIAILHSDTDDFTLSFRAGETQCSSGTPGNWDCEIAVAFFVYPSTFVYSAGQALWFPPPPATALGVKSAALSYECDGVCDTNWQSNGTLPFGATDPNQTIVLPPPQQNPYYEGFSNSYLAPILGNEIPTDLGGYLANIFQVLIIIAGVLAFLYIIIGAIQYMTSVGGGGKAEGRGKMENAVFGLILALGAWVVLNTINPNLASNLGFNLPQVGGRDTPQIPVNGKYCNGAYDAGAPWYDDSVVRSNLINNGILINKKNCTKVGQRSCTSVYNLGQTAIDKLIALKNSCGENCEVTVNGATECWLHGGNTGNGTNHQVGNNTVDVNLNVNLDAFIRSEAGGTSTPTTFSDKFVIPAGVYGGDYHWEWVNRHATVKKSSHWHVEY